MAIERKGLETIQINDFSAFMVTSNHDAPLKIERYANSCFDVSAHCRDNTYFDMSYLLSRDYQNGVQEKVL